MLRPDLNQVVADAVVEGDSKDACEGRGGVWAPLPRPHHHRHNPLLSDFAADAEDQRQLVYPTWFVRLLFFFVFLLSGILFTTLYLVWFCFGRKNFRYGLFERCSIVLICTGFSHLNVYCLRKV